MIKIIGIGRCGRNILEFVSKQNFQIKKTNFDFVFVKNVEDIENIEISEDDTIFTISGLGGSIGSKLTKEFTKKIIEKGIRLKNIVILPFSIESNSKKAIADLEELIEINQNLEVYANEDVADKDLTMSQLMRLHDVLIFDRVSRENQVNWRNFIIEKKVENISYKALMTFWSKNLKVTLLEPSFKVIGNTHMPLMAPSRIAFKDEDKSTSSIQDIEEIAYRVLNEYIKCKN